MTEEMRRLGAYAKVVRETKEEFSAFEMISKESSGLMKAANAFLRIVSLNQMKTFMTGYVTTIGEKVYVPSDWEDRDYLLRAVTLRHERVHMRQKKRVGMLAFSFLYLFWIFPIGLALSRRMFEQEAYEESLRASVEYFGEAVLKDPIYRQRIISHFVGPDYLWTWPFRGSIEAWYDDLVMSIQRELSQK